MKTVITTIVGIALLCFFYSSALAETTATPNAPTMQQLSSNADMNKANGDKFLNENKQKSGVVTLPSGLQYKILTAGKGQKPTINDVVTVQYEGKLINGTVFDSSYKRNQPATFPVNGVIPGWVEALQQMPVGSVWELYIPANLAYGETGAPPVIGPNEVLVFKVNLMDIKK